MVSLRKVDKNGNEYSLDLVPLELSWFAHEDVSLYFKEESILAYAYRMDGKQNFWATFFYIW